MSKVYQAQPLFKLSLDKVTLFRVEDFLNLPEPVVRRILKKGNRLIDNDSPVSAKKLPPFSGVSLLLFRYQLAAIIVEIPQNREDFVKVSARLSNFKRIVARAVYHHKYFLNDDVIWWHLVQLVDYRPYQIRDYKFLRQGDHQVNHFKRLFCNLLEFLDMIGPDTVDPDAVKAFIQSKANPRVIDQIIQGNFDSELFVTQNMVIKLKGDSSEKKLHVKIKQRAVSSFHVTFTKEELELDNLEVWTFTDPPLWYPPSKRQWPKSTK